MNPAAYASARWSLRKSDKPPREPLRPRGEKT
jgi:hypothetical protein